MKKILAVATMVSMVALFAAPAAIGGETDDLIIYLTNDSSADILVTNTTGGGDATWYPTAGIGESDSTGLGDYNLSNNGSVQVDVDIKGAVTTGTAWSLGSEAGHDTIYVAYNWTSHTETEITTGDLDFTNDLAHNGFQNFGLMLDMPTSTSTADNHDITLTFTATVD